MPVVLELVQSLEKGGRTKRVLETASGLRRVGWSVKVLPMTEPPDWVRKAYSGDACWLSLPKRAGLDPLYILRLLRLVRREQVALIHAHCESSFFYGGVVARLAGVPIAGTYHRSDLAYFQPRFRLRSFARLLTGAVAISRDRMRLMIAQLGIPADRITLIHGGVDTASFQPRGGETVAALKRKLDVEGRRVLLAAGHLGPIKGHDVTLEAIAQLRERWPDLLLVIAGDGAEADYQRLNAVVKKLGLEQRVRLLGQVHNVPDWLSVCEFFVQPSIEEGFGLVFVEAGASARAVVATDVGGIKDIVVDGETGLLVAPGDVSALRHAIGKLLEDPALASSFGDAGRQRVEACFSTDGMVSKYDALFSALVGGVE